MVDCKTSAELPASSQYSSLQSDLKSQLIFDHDAYSECLREKKGAVPFLKNSLREAAEHLNQRFENGFPISQLVIARAWYIDQVLLSLWKQCLLDQTEGLALLAVGGYGRAELLPHSDVDLLILMSDDLELSTVSSQIELFVTSLFDTNLDIGHSVRNLSECLEHARKDITIATNLLETRTLAGSESLRLKLSQLAYTDESWTDRDFFAAKRDEQLSRHEKYGDTDYNLEPNVKTSPGCLRDIQTIGWITKRHFGFRSDSPDTGYEFLTDDEITVLREGEAFLWQLRYGLQMIAGRNENRLLFDHQRTLANLLQYKDSEKTLGVEKMMQRYYRNSLQLRELNDVVLQHYEEVIILADQPQQPVKLNRRFQVNKNYIEAINNGVFAWQPFAMLEVFLLMAQDTEITGIRASTIRAIRAHRHLIDEEFRKDLANSSIFMEILRTPHALHKTLSAMKRYGVLGQYLPEFGRIIGKMQYDLFHVYTVDKHTEHVIRHMIKLQGTNNLDCPLASTLARQLPKIELLYIAGMYHDIGKGRGGNHSVLGAADVEDFCRRHHLSSRDTSLVSWLVENHLLMSVTAQKKDISDPEIIHEFANQIDTQVHLDYLYTLTVADINATNPKLWNNWRAALLRQLYNETKRVLRKGLEEPPDRQRWIKQTQAEVKELLLGKGFSPDAINELWQELDEEYFLQDSTREIARQTALILRHQKEKPLVRVKNAREGEAKGFLQIMIYQRSRPGQFAVITATLEQLKLNIHDARVSSFPNNFSLSNYVVSPPDPTARTTDFKETIKAELIRQLEDLNRPDIVNRRTSRLLKHFSFPTEVIISFDTTIQKTVLEVVTPDRPGLLARIAGVFLDNQIGLVKARIATLGERVEDVFVITDNKGQPLNDDALCKKLRDDICAQLDDAQNTT